MNQLRLLGTVVAVPLLLVLASARPSLGQAVTGEIVGRVTDSSGQVVPGAAVTAVHVATNVSRSVISNDTGGFTLTLLTPGKYSVSAELTGFRRVVHPDVEVLVGARLTLGLMLQIGNVSETVTVSGTPPLIETTRSDLGGVITSREIAELPLLNRTFANLSVIMPEARPAGNFDPTKTRVGNFAMNGGDGRQLDVNVDGGDNKDNVVGSLLQNFAYESIQEFRCSSTAGPLKVAAPLAAW